MTDPGEKYAAMHYAPRTETIYGACEAAYDAFCARRGVAGVPGSPSVVREFLVGIDGRGSTVAINARAIARAHARAGLPSPTGDRKVVQAVKAAKARSGPPQIPPAVGVGEIRAALATLDPELPIDAREGALILILFLSGLGCRDLRTADRSRTKIDGHGVTLHVRRGSHHVGAGTSPETCPAWWTARWLAHVGTDPGPLFVSLNPRGGWSRRPMGNTAVHQALRRVWERAAIGGPPPNPRRMRRGFAAAALKCASPIVVAYQVRARTMSDLRDGLHLSGIPRNDHWSRQRGRARRDVGVRD